MYNNPFAVNRTEYMKNLWKYYVPFNYIDSSINKSIVVAGGRGTGKSMYFLCNCWREKYAELQEQSKTPLKELLEQKQIGLYYKVDSTFVGAMSDCEKWAGYFNTYLSISIISELLPFVKILHDDGIISSNVIKTISKVFFSVSTKNKIDNLLFENMQKKCTDLLQEIEDLINGCNADSISLRLTQPGTILRTIVNELHKIDILSNVVFKVYIDEYESFLEWQQRIVNTLIKQSNNGLIYNIGMRHNGMKTMYTLGENEILQATHDYQYINFDEFLSEKEYKSNLRDICKKRLEMFILENKLNDQMVSTNIEFYLSNYNIDKEIERFKKHDLGFKRVLEQLIYTQAQEKDDTQELINVLCTNAPVINARLHLALLLRSPSYRPCVAELYECYIAWTTRKTDKSAKRYKEWLHNAKNGLVFLLAKDCNMTKWYYGFDTYAMLSSGVIRYFLELCEQAFNIAIVEGFSWEQAESISPEIQTRAARYVSQYKVNEILTYPRCGKRLRIFVQCFGEICRDLHRNDNTTLGEPEVNHFTTESLELSSEILSYLDDAETLLVFQKLPQTKSKDEIRTTIVDYHLNKIYTPYFEISYNKKRKIVLSENQLEKFLSEDVSIAHQAAKEYLDNYWKRKSQISAFEFANRQESQISFFEEEQS